MFLYGTSCWHGLVSAPKLTTPAVLAPGATLVVRHCAGVAPGDHCLIVTDQSRRIEGEAIAAAVAAAGGNPLVVDVSAEVARYFATGLRPEPPDNLAGAFAASDYVFNVANVEYAHMLGHTEKNQAAQDAGMQYILVAEEMWAWTTTPADIDDIYERMVKVAELARASSEMSVTSPAGTDLRIRLSPGRKVWIFGTKTSSKREALIVPNYGECAVAPQEWTAEGTAVIDGSIPVHGIGQVTEPVVLRIETGRVVSIDGGESADRLQRLVADAGENADAVAECGLCLSHKERRPYEYQGTPGHFSYGGWGTSHIALGHNHTIGGEIHSSVHVDCQMYDTTVHIDDHCVMESGVYQI